MNAGFSRRPGWTRFLSRPDARPKGWAAPPALRALEVLESRLAAGSVLPAPWMSGLLALWPFSQDSARLAPPPRGSAGVTDHADASAILNHVAAAVLPARPEIAIGSAPSSYAAAVLNAGAVDALLAGVRPAELGGQQLFRSFPAAPEPVRLNAHATGTVGAPAGSGELRFAAPASPTTAFIPQSAQVPAMGVPTVPASAPVTHAPRAPAPATAAATASAAAQMAAPSLGSGRSTLAVATNNGVPVQFVVTPARGLFTHEDGKAWSRVGGDGSILSVSAVTDAPGSAVAFIITADHALYRYDATGGWQKLGDPGTVATVSAGTDVSGQAAAYILTADGSFTVYTAAAGWPASPPGAPGSVLAVSAGKGGRSAVLTSDHSIYEYNLTSGWLRRTAAGFAQSVSAVSAGNLVVYAITSDNGLARHDDGVGWRQYGAAGSVGSVSPGTDASGQAQAFVLTALGEPYLLTSSSTWVQLGSAQSAQLVRGGSQGRGYFVSADASFFVYSGQTGWQRLTGAAFAAGSLSPTVIVQSPEFTTGQGVTAQVLISAANTSAGAMQVQVNVDRNNDGTFTDPGEANVAGGVVQPGVSTFALGDLPRGTFQVQALVSDGAGDSVASGGVMTVSDPYAGMIGSQPLNDLSAAYQAVAGAPPAPGARGPAVKLPDSFFNPFRRRYLQFDSQQRVLVHVRPTLGKYRGALQSELQALGLRVSSTNSAQNLVNGWLPLGAIANLTGLAHYDAVAPAYRPIRHVGAVTSQGDAVIKADTFRTATGFSGENVVVGAISDSVNQFNGGLADSVRTGDLPPNVRVLQDGAPGSTDEGRAMLEIIHDVAPSAGLAFSTDGFSPQDMANSIDGLVKAGANVITDDVTFLDEPMFNDGLLSQAAQSAVDRGVFYTTSAGNSGSAGWIAPWTSATATVGGITGTYDGLGNTVVQPFTLPVGGFLDLTVQWDAAYIEGGGSSLPNFQVPNNVDVYVTSADGTQVLASATDINQSTNEAFEQLQITNVSTNGTTQFGLAYRLVSGPAPNFIRWVAQSDGVDPMAFGEGNIGTSYGHETTRDVVTAAASDYRTPTVPESFSARGGNIPILFDFAGNRLATPDIRMKPDLTAPDDVNTTFFVPGVDTEPDGFPNFQGTSAATPHVAGAAALQIAINPGNDPRVITALLEQTALDLSTPGWDAATGFGLVQLVPGVGPGPGALPPSQLPDDQFERNDTSDQAIGLGALAGVDNFTNLTINVHPDDGLPDYDWYRLRTAFAGPVTVSITIRPERGDLELHLFTLGANNQLIELTNSTDPGAKTRTVRATFDAGQVVLVEVKGHNAIYHQFGTGTYDLNIRPG